MRPFTPATLKYGFKEMRNLGELEMNCINQAFLYAEFKLLNTLKITRNISYRLVKR
jgi:hypothetical protein